MKNTQIINREILNSLFWGLALILVVTSTQVRADETKTRTVTLKNLKLELPENWKQKQSNSRFRLGEFEIPAAKEGAAASELILFHFKGGAGRTDDNITRWINQFSPKGRKSAVKKGKSAAGEYVWVDVTGDYKKSVGAPFLGKFELMENARVISVILNTDDDVYYLKLVGTQEAVKALEAAYRKSFGGDAKTEAEYKTTL